MLFRFLSTFLFSEEKSTLSLREFSGFQVIPYIKSGCHYVTVGVIRHLCLRRGSSADC